jgi:hypothetical protein
MAIAQARALPDIILIRYIVFERSEGKEEGCSSMMRETPDRFRLSSEAFWGR